MLPCLPAGGGEAFADGFAPPPEQAVKGGSTLIATIAMLAAATLIVLLRAPDALTLLAFATGRARRRRILRRHPSLSIAELFAREEQGVALVIDCARAQPTLAAFLAHALQSLEYRNYAIVLLVPAGADAIADSLLTATRGYPRVRVAEIDPGDYNRGRAIDGVLRSLDAERPFQIVVEHNPSGALHPFSLAFFNWLVPFHGHVALPSIPLDAPGMPIGAQLGADRFAIAHYRRLLGDQLRLRNDAVLTSGSARAALLKPADEPRTLDSIDLRLLGFGRLFRVRATEARGASTRVGTRYATARSFSGQIAERAAEFAHGNGRPLATALAGWAFVAVAGWALERHGVTSWRTPWPWIGVGAAAALAFAETGIYVTAFYGKRRALGSIERVVPAAIVEGAAAWLGLVRRCMWGGRTIRPRGFPRELDLARFDRTVRRLIDGIVTQPAVREPPDPIAPILSAAFAPRPPAPPPLPVSLDLAHAPIGRTLPLELLAEYPLAFGEIGGELILVTASEIEPAALEEARTQLGEPIIVRRGTLDDVRRLRAELRAQLVVRA